MVNCNSKMPEAEVVYSDVKFTKTKKYGNGTEPSPPDATYAEVEISKTESSKELPGSQQQAVSNGGSKVTSERVAIAVLSILLVAALVALGYTSHKNIQTMERLQQLTAINKNLTERRCEENKCDKVPITCPPPPAEPCRKCEEGWEIHETQCYYFSDKKSAWEKAREECLSHNGDLVKIDSKLEQSFLQHTLKGKMESDEDKFWIGLTDSKKEGEWLWVDSSPLNESLKNWVPGEPDDWKGTNGEDCARMGERGGPDDQKQWFDRACKVPNKSICEKSASKGHLQCVCNVDLLQPIT